MSYFHNIKNRLALYAEVTWGTKPGSPTYVAVPYTNYGVQFKGDRRNASAQTGLRQRKHGETFRGMPSGQMTLPLYGWHPTGLTTSLAQWMLDWGFADSGGTIHEAIDLPSRGAELAEGPDIANKRHSGLRVNTTTLTGNGDAGTIELALDLMGKDEVNFATAQAIPTNHYELTEFGFEDTVFQIDDGAGGSLVTVPISSFQLQVANNLRSDYVGGSRPTLMVAGERVCTLQIAFPKQDDTWDALRRSVAASGDEPSYVASLVLKGLHKGTGTALTNWTRCTISLPKLQYVSHDDQRSRDDIARLPLQFEVMKPDSASNDVGIVWADVA